MRYRRYKVEEFYKGKKLVVFVRERWSCKGIESANVFCEGNSLVRSIGHRYGNYKSHPLGGIVGELIARLTTEDVDDVILHELKIAESLIDNNIYDDLSFYDFEKRFFNVVFEYDDNKMAVQLYIDFNSKDVYIFNDNELIINSTLENGEYRRFLFYIYWEFKEKIDLKNNSKVKKI